MPVAAMLTFFKHLSPHSQPPFCLVSATGEIQANAHILIELMMVMVRKRLSGMIGRPKYNVFYLVLPKDFWKLSTSKLKKEKMSSCSADVKL